LGFKSHYLGEENQQGGQGRTGEEVLAFLLELWPEIFLKEGVGGFEDLGRV